MNRYVNKYTALAITLIWMMGVFFVFDPVPAPDSYRYLQEAELANKHGVNYFEKSNSAPYYWLYPIVLGMMKGFVEGEMIWDAAFYLNIILYAASAFIFYKILEWFCRPLISLLGLLAFLGCFEMWHWTYYLLTEIPYIFLCIAFFYQLYHPKCHTLVKWCFLFFTGLGILFIKPVGFIYVGLCLGGYLIRYVNLRISRYQLGIIFGLIILFVGGVYSLLVGSADSGLGVNTYLEGFAGHFRNGDIIKDRSEYRIDQGELHWLLYGLKLFFLRVFYFWCPLIQGYSISHLLYNGVYLLPIFVFGLLGMIKQLLYERESVFLSLFFILVGFTGFHAATFLDFGHRYRSPLIWIVLLFACIFLQYLVDKFPKIRRKFVK